MNSQSDPDQAMRLLAGKLGVFYPAAAALEVAESRRKFIEKIPGAVRVGSIDEAEILGRLAAIDDCFVQAENLLKRAVDLTYDAAVSFTREF